MCLVLENKIEQESLVSKKPTIMIVPIFSKAKSGTIADTVLASDY